MQWLHTGRSSCLRLSPIIGHIFSPFTFKEVKVSRRPWVLSWDCRRRSASTAADLAGGGRHLALFFRGALAAFGLFVVAIVNEQRQEFPDFRDRRQR
jgi:hypothetical protein